MNFRKRSASTEPDINLIPFIDVLLVVLIFLMLTTSWSRLTEIQLNLPLADAQAQKDRPQQIVLSVDAQGQYAVNQAAVSNPSVQGLVRALAPLAGQDVTLVISADAQASHQSVVHAMEAARAAGLTQITFATRASRSSGP